MTRRRLRPEEVELWRKVTETTHRLYPDRPLSEIPKPKPKPVKSPSLGFRGLDGNSGAIQWAPKPDNTPAFPAGFGHMPIQMDHKTHKKLSRGKLKPEAKIDLHGMTIDQAHPALTSFIFRAHRDKKRLVLVVTGKGRTSDPYGRRGVLKHQVPQWLALPPIATAVLHITQAHVKHGGSGALYVYLKRSR